MVKKNTRFDELLNYSNRNYDIHKQKAELLFRNKAFLLDFAKLDTYFSLTRYGQQIFDALMKEAGSRLPKDIPIDVHKVSLVVSIGISFSAELVGDAFSHRLSHLATVRKHKSRLGAYQ